MTDLDTADARMDARLHAAGERWRTRQPEGRAAEQGFDVVTRAEVRPRRRLATAMLSAAAVALLAAGVAVVAIRNAGPEPSAAAGTVEQLRAGDWMLTKVDGRAVSDNARTLHVIGSAVLVDDGCSLRTLPAAVRAHRLDIRSAGAAACSDRVARELASALRDAVGWSVTPAGLTLTGNGTTLAFRSPPVVPSPPPASSADARRLLGTAWTVVHTTSAAGRVDPAAWLTVTFPQQAHGQVSIATGGWAYGFAITVRAGQLRFGSRLTDSDPGTCPSRDTAYATLHGTVRWAITDGLLVLHGDGGDTVVLAPGAYPSAGLTC